MTLDDLELLVIG